MNSPHLIGVTVSLVVPVEKRAVVLPPSPIGKVNVRAGDAEHARGLQDAMGLAEEVDRRRIVDVLDGVAGVDDLGRAVFDRQRFELHQVPGDGDPAAVPVGVKVAGVVHVRPGGMGEVPAADVVKPPLDDTFLGVAATIERQIVVRTR